MSQVLLVRADLVQNMEIAAQLGEETSRKPAKQNGDSFGYALALQGSPKFRAQKQ